LPSRERPFFRPSVVAGVLGILVAGFAFVTAFIPFNEKTDILNNTGKQEEIVAAFCALWLSSIFVIFFQQLEIENKNKILVDSAKDELSRSISISNSKILDVVRIDKAFFHDQWLHDKLMEFEQLMKATDKTLCVTNSLLSTFTGPPTT
jgi:hypothetical protein